MEKIDLLLENASQLLTCEADRHAPNKLTVRDHVSLAVSGDRIAGIGSTTTLEKRFDLSAAKKLNAAGKVVAPGFVDCHTHLVFGGSRVTEYVTRLTTDDVSEIKKACGKIGLDASAEMTRRASVSELTDSSLKKLTDMLHTGTTTVEIKSGYGLETETELKQLEVIGKLGDLQPVTVVPTFLGAHGWPEDMTKADYLELLKKETLPLVAEQRLAVYCDIWCDDGYYTARECEDLLKTALDYGIKPKIHTDAYSYIGGSDLAAEMGMVSADHLNYTPVAQQKKMAAAGVVAVVLPGTDFSVAHPKPFNPRPMSDNGLTLALGTNLNPGNWIASMQLIMALACRNHRMTPQEAVMAATSGGAAALGLGSEIGSLKEGYYADIQVWDTDNYEDVIYKVGGNLVQTVIKRGKIVYERV